MLRERLLSTAIRSFARMYFKLHPTTDRFLPPPEAGRRYMLYAHVPFCERLCPYCSFNRFPFDEPKARRYFKNLRGEMAMLDDLGYDFESLYIGGGTPTILLDELCETIDEAKRRFSIGEVSCETNPNHLVEPYLSALSGRVQRLSVGVQSFDDGLLRQMSRYEKYGSGAEVLERVQEASRYIDGLNIDMIFNFPAQTTDILINDVERAIESGADQVTFYPLMASPSVERSLRNSVGSVDYNREYKLYEIICELLCGGPLHLFEHGSAWTFNRTGGVEATAAATGKTFAPGFDDVEGAPVVPEKRQLIDEYVVNYEEYPAIGSGGITYLGSHLFVNTFSVNDYNDDIESGVMSLMGKTAFTKRDRMRYRLLMQLFGLRFDKQAFRRDFGCTIERGLPVEFSFLKLAGAFEKDTDDELALTPMGRYLTVVMMRQFFIGVNELRDQAREALHGEERKLLFGDGDEA